MRSVERKKREGEGNDRSLASIETRGSRPPSEERVTRVGDGKTMEKGRSRKNYILLEKFLSRMAAARGRRRHVRWKKTDFVVSPLMIHHANLSRTTLKGTSASCARSPIAALRCVTVVERVSTKRAENRHTTFHSLDSTVRVWRQRALLISSILVPYSHNPRKTSLTLTPLRPDKHASIEKWYGTRSFCTIDLHLFRNWPNINVRLNFTSD